MSSHGTMIILRLKKTSKSSMRSTGFIKLSFTPYPSDFDILDIHIINVLLTSTCYQSKGIYSAEYFIFIGIND